MHAYRTHTCNQLRASDVNAESGKHIKLSGWVHRVRDHGGLAFIDLRDHYGITQLVVDATDAENKELIHVRNESVVTIEGSVVLRTPETINKNLPTGEIEVSVANYTIESIADVLPLQVNSDAEFPEATRLTYRFLDLRREKLHKNIVLRSKIISSLRQRMTAQGFLEYQTPILTASSPEGARDYLVPSRVHPGKFYALPQAPQMFKQLLMVSGFDRYFQIAPCFRDEDARADRSPGEFYQLDIEMSFVTQEDVFAAIEPVLSGVFAEFSDWKIVVNADGSFPRIAYDEAMLTYGSDKPDLRNPLKIVDVTEIFQAEAVSFKAFKGKTVRAIAAPNTADKPRSFFDKLNEWIREEGGAGLGYITVEYYNENIASIEAIASAGSEDVYRIGGPIGKFIPSTDLIKLLHKSGAVSGSTVFFVADEKALTAAKFAGKARTKIAEEMNLIEHNVFKFCWVVDFPYYELNDEGKIDFSHNPFSMPQGGLEALENAFAGADNKNSPLKSEMSGETKEKLLTIKAFQYDIVCNGVELSSGAIRNHKPEIMVKAFEIAGYTRADVENRFAALFNAFHYGAPPHGGLAPGVDRMVMLLANEPNIREVICFPMNQQAQDLLMQAPNVADEKALRELHIQLSPKAKQTLEEERAKASDAA